ncbi:hypothetical protein L218DRAFT_1080711 [Marasmius fiardii PR-910]|nr:hypothetical protein L218DRAFT_1080711 [Marasmius fiardii PR-910]
MIAYLFYNADFFSILVPSHKDSVSMGFVDDKTVVAIAKTLDETTKALKTFIEQPDGGFAWAHSHNLTFSIPKMAICHYSRRKVTDPSNSSKLINKPRPTLELCNSIVKREKALKVVGVFLDEELHWHTQCTYAIGKATSLVMAYRQLTKQAKGLLMRAAWKLYLMVVIPKMTYGISMWYTPPNTLEGGKCRSGVAAVLENLPISLHFGSFGVIITYYCYEN